MGTGRHVWGRSAARDRVWSHVNGLGSEKARNRLLAVWQAFIDESVDEKFFVIGGFIETAETWANFSDEWSEMLPYSTRGKDGSFEFKMVEMAKNPERLERAQAFYRIVERWLSFCTVFVMKLSDVSRARERIVLTHRNGQNVVLEEGVGFLANNYLFAWNMFMRETFRNREIFARGGVIPLDQKIDFIFDERMHEKKEIYAHWDGWVERLKEKDLVGGDPRFADSTEFMPLQAADFVCWWIRERMHQIQGAPVDGWSLPWPAERRIGYFWGHMDEDQILAYMMRICRTAIKEIGAPVVVSDAKGVIPSLSTYS